MLRALSSQWLKLRRPSVLLGTVGTSLFFAAVATVITFSSADDAGTTRDAPGGPGLSSAAELARADGLVAGAAGASQLLGVIALVLAAFAVASEYQHGTLRNLLVRQPRRLVLLGGSAVAVGLVVVLAALAATAASVVTALAVAGSAGIETGAWTAGEAVRGFALTAASMLGFALVGAVLALVLRSPVAAIGAGVAYVIPVESILAGISSAAQDVLPGQLLAAVADGTASAPNLALLAAWLAGAAALAAWLFARRDVAA